MILGVVEVISIKCRVVLGELIGREASSNACLR